MKKQCSICEGFSDSQHEMLSTPTYRICKDKKAGILVSPKDVTVTSSIDSEPTFQSPSGAIAQVPAQPPSSQPPAIASTLTPSSPPPPSYVTAEQFSAISDKWAHAWRLFSPEVMFFPPLYLQSNRWILKLWCLTHFLALVTRPAGPAGVLVAVEATETKESDSKPKKNSHKSRRGKSSDNVKSGSQAPSERSSEKKSDGKQKKRDRSRSPGSKSSTKHGRSSSPPILTSSAKPPATIKGDALDRPSSVADKGVPLSSQKFSSSKSQPVQEQPFTGTDACAYRSHEESGPYEQMSEYEEGDDDDRDRSGELSGSDDGNLSDSTDTPEQTEEMSYRETVRSVRSYMGWHHIPTFETNFSELDKSNNPWKANNPRKPT